MSLMRWFESDPFSQFDKMRNDLEKLSTYYRPFSGNFWGSAIYPPMNIYDDGESFIVRAEVPGVEPKDLDVSVVRNTLTIKGKRTISESEEENSYHRRERNWGEFRRAFTLPEQVDVTKVFASVKNGILEVRLPRSLESKSRRIEIATK